MCNKGASAGLGGARETPQQGTRGLTRWPGKHQDLLTSAPLWLILGGIRHSIREEINRKAAKNLRVIEATLQICGVWYKRRYSHDESFGWVFFWLPNEFPCSSPADVMGDVTPEGHFT